MKNEEGTGTACYGWGALLLSGRWELPAMLGTKVGSAGVLPPWGAGDQSEKLAHREAKLAEREATLAAYMADIAARSVAADKTIAAERKSLEEERAAMEARRIALEKSERALERRVRAAEEWEANLRSREVELAMSGGAPPPVVESTVEEAVEAAASEETASSLGVEGVEGVEARARAVQLDAVRYAAIQREAYERAPSLDQLHAELQPELDEEGMEEEAVDEEDEGADEYGFGEDGLADDGAAWLAVRDDMSGRIYYWNQVDRDHVHGHRRGWSRR